MPLGPLSTHWRVGQFRRLQWHIAITAGNDDDKLFTVSRGGTNHTFGSFECAIATLAPVCSHCGCHIIGHGVEVDGAFYCCVHCAQQAGITGIRDRADHQDA